MSPGDAPTDRPAPESSPAGVPTRPGRDLDRWKPHIPNALSVARLILAAILFLILDLWDGTGSGILWIAIVLFVVAALTDTFDGILARRWKVISRFGRVVDPLADKVLILGSFIALAGPSFSDGSVQLSGVAPWMAIVLLARELLVTSLRGLAEGAGVDFSAMASGKAKMVLQSVAVPIILLTIAIADDPAAGTPRWIIVLTVWATLLVTVWSALPYITKAMKIDPEKLK